MTEANVLISLACILGLLMTWGVGANDLANVMSTSMGSKALSIRQAVFVAVVFEFAGAFIAGSHVTATLRGGIINPTVLVDQPEILIYGMLAVLAAGTTWMGVASFYGLPVSITHTIVGSIVGFGLIVAGVETMHWSQIGKIGISWVTSPLIAGLSSYLLFISIQMSILGRSQPVRQAKFYMPIYAFLVGFVLSAMTVLSSLSRAGYHFALLSRVGIAVICGLLITVLAHLMMRKTVTEPTETAEHNPFSRFVEVEKLFSVLMLFTACAMVFAHGSNDVANAVGPMAVVITIVKNQGNVMQGALPAWIVLLGCTGVIVGFLMYGRKVIETVGSGITALTPSRAFAATLAAATTVVVATSLGIPVSATQTLVGAVLGVGLARGIGALNMRVIRNIFLSWVITIPLGATLTVIYFFILKAIFGGHP